MMIRSYIMEMSEVMAQSLSFLVVRRKMRAVYVDEYVGEEYGFTIGGGNE